MKSTSPRPRRPKTKNTFVTHSGKTIKINRNLSDRLKANRASKARRKAAYLSELPKEPWKRFLYRISPKRLARYWFSREGGIMALKVAGIAFVIGFLIIVGIFAYFRKDLPQIKDISGNNFGGSITYYARDAKTVLFQDYTDRKRTPVSSDNISQFVKDATVAVEDKNFYKHGAFDTKGIIRAGINDITGAGSTQGGSTITQQLVKINEGWTNDHTISRKVKELILAVELEREYSKNDILIGYLNMAPYGNVDYGVEAAAQDYFHVSAKDLTLAQSAMLAAIPKAPGDLSPYSSPNYNAGVASNYFDSVGLIDRTHYILDLMAQQGYINQKQADEAKNVDILAQIQPLQSHYANMKAPYFVLAARDQLRQEFPAAVVNRGGWKVVTTLDMNMQNLAEVSLRDGAAQIKRQHADSAAFVAEDNETGQVLALIGGTDFNNTSYGEINYATDVNISPGSSIKPYDYTTFINNNTNVGAGSILYDSVGPLPGYPCTVKGKGGNCLNDYDFRSIGPTTLRYAIGGSRNIPAVKAMLLSVPDDKSSLKTTSINKVLSTASALMSRKDGSDGYRCYVPGTDVTTATKADQTQCYAAAGIGDGAYLHLNDHVNGIASIARLGKAIPQTFILKVTNSSGKTLSQFKQPEGKQVVKADAAYIVDDMASDPGASYLGGSCTATNCSGMKFHRYKGWNIAIKTGTTNDQYDGLMMTWNTKFTAGIWVGNHTRTVSYSGQPENMTDPIMKQFMHGAIDSLGNVPAKNWVQPAGIKTLAAYVMHTVPYRSQTTPTPSTDIFPSWFVGKNKTSAQTIDKVSGLLATSCTPEAAKQISNNSNVATWNVDIFMGGSSGTDSNAVSLYDNVHNCNDTPPTASVTAINGAPTGSGTTTITCPLAGCDVSVYVEQGTALLTDSARSNFPGTVSLLINGQSVQSQAVSSTGVVHFNYFPGTGASGTVQIGAQVIDSVLYQGTSSSIPTAIDTTSTTPTTQSAPTTQTSGH
jgi:penicillin-binding protein 1A